MNHILSCAGDPGRRWPTVRGSVLPSAAAALAVLAALAGACADVPACESGRYAFCFETFPPADQATTAENPETNVRFVLETDELEALVFLDVPSGVQADTIGVAFGGDDRHAQVQLNIGEDTFWGSGGQVVVERHDDARIVGHGENVELDESLRSPEDGDRLAYLGRLDFDLTIDHQGD